MNRSTHTSSFRMRYLMALGLGLFLGQAVALMAHQGEGSWQGFGIATLFVASASASFVLFMLGQQRGAVPSTVLSRQAHSLAGVIGLGLLMSLRAVEFLA
ncbi:MAG: hypothetical protein ABI605_00925 [Rhizobacter sp.]